MIKGAKDFFFFFYNIFSINSSLSGFGGQTKTKTKAKHWVTKVTDTVHSGIKNTLNWFGRSAEGKQDWQWSLFTQ